MSARYLKLRVLLLLSLVPLALRATTLLLGGHGVAPAASSSPRRSSWAWHGASSRATAATATAASAVVSAAGPVHDRPYRHDDTRRRRRSSEGAASDSARRLRQADGDWFEDDKRLAPTGSNPLHNLR